MLQFRTSICMAWAVDHGGRGFLDEEWAAASSSGLPINLVSLSTAAAKACNENRTQLASRNDDSDASMWTHS